VREGGCWIAASCCFGYWPDEPLEPDPLEPDPLLGSAGALGADEAALEAVPVALLAAAPASELALDPADDAAEPACDAAPEAPAL
jgi:hypothetical protein